MIDTGIPTNFSTHRNALQGRYWFFLDLGLYETAEFVYFDATLLHIHVAAYMGRSK